MYLPPTMVELIPEYLNQDWDLIWGDWESLIQAIVEERPAEQLFKLLGELSAVIASPLDGEELRRMLRLMRCAYFPHNDVGAIRDWLDGLRGDLGAALWATLNERVDE